jgi:Cu/Ag efflux pump CusA
MAKTSAQFTSEINQRISAGSLPAEAQRELQVAAENFAELGLVRGETAAQREAALDSYLSNVDPSGEETRDFVKRLRRLHAEELRTP